MPAFSSALRSDLDLPRFGAWQAVRLVHSSRHARCWLGRPAGRRLSDSADYLIKSLHPQHEGHPGAIERLRREARAAGETASPHVVPVLEAQIDRSPRFLVMPRLEGVDLATLVREAPEPLRRMLRAARHLSLALAALHKAGWRHGDVKPHNAVLSPDGHATLIDLGLASRLDEPPPAGLFGTPAYAAPELLDGRGPCGSRTDSYGLGATLYFLLAGRPPMDSQATFPTPRFDRLPDRLPRGARGLLRRLLADDPADRPPAVHVADELAPMEIEAFAWGAADG